MARALRIEYEGAFYHVTSRGNERKKIFFSKSDYQRFKSYLESAIDKYEYRLHAYILMGNHYHLLIETGKANLNKLLSEFKLQVHQLVYSRTLHVVTGSLGIFLVYD
jgi:putative transposase